MSVAHVPGHSLANGAACWLELLQDGLTFDLSGLAPGAPDESAQFAFRFDCPPEIREAKCETMWLVPGPHLEAGTRSPPILRGMCALGAALTKLLPAVRAVGWLPSASLMGTDYFRSTVQAWIGGGPFPALGLTAFRPTVDGALQSVGLAHFTGQEVRLDPALSTDRTAATRLGVRLVNLLVGIGPLEKTERITAPDGRTLQLVPAPDRRLVRVSAG